MMTKYDDYLRFNLPEGFEFLDDVNEDGERIVQIQSGKSIDDNGDVNYKYCVQMAAVSEENSPFETNSDEVDSIFKLKGNIDNKIHVSTEEQKILFFTVNVFKVIIWLRKDEHEYALISQRAAQSLEDEEVLEWLEMYNQVLSSIVLGGEQCSLELLTKEHFSASKTASVDLLDKLNGVFDEMMKEADDRFPKATPGDGQHTHLDYLNNMKGIGSMLGGLMRINESGTEYSFQSIAQMADRECDEENAVRNKAFQAIRDSDQGTFHLAETAHDMAELFREEEKFFDAGHDREQDIENGLIHRASIYNTFRSFAWTLQAFCNREGVEPAALPFDVLEEMEEFISFHDGINYTADSFSPTICSGDDLHVYYIPDLVEEQYRNALLEGDSSDDGTACSEIRSLDGLREELTYMYPAIRMIYDTLEAERNRTVPLNDGLADILYAWCSMTYAAREPIYSEDGPMNCWWEHPDKQVDWERQMKINQLEWAIKQKEDWLSNYRDKISKNVSITFKDKLFVFTGADREENWLDILQALINKGGIQRSAVSGKTDYLICNPYYAGDSQVKRALEQRIKGKDVKILLFEDLLSALGMTVKTPEQRLEELKNEKKETTKEKHLLEVTRPKEMYHSNKEKPTDFTYEEKHIVKGEGYTMLIPDCMAVKEDIDDRDFVAYIPSKTNPDDYDSSNFIIYAGKSFSTPDGEQALKTMPEYYALFQQISQVYINGMGNSDTLNVMNVTRRDLPGGVFSIYEQGALHAICFFALENKLKMMRVLVNNISKSDRKVYEKLILKLFEHMKADRSVYLLEELDAAKYIEEKFDESILSEWSNLAEEYVTRFANSRNMTQNQLANSFKEKQEKGTANVPEFLNLLQKMLENYSGYFEEQLRKVEVVYTIQSEMHSSDSILGKIKDILLKFVELSDQYVNVSDHKLEANSAYAAKVKKRLDTPVQDLLSIITADETAEFTESQISALTRAKTSSRTIGETAASEKNNKSTGLPDGYEEALEMFMMEEDEEKNLTVDENDMNSESDVSLIGRPHFFCDLDSLQYILQKEYDPENYNDLEISVDLMELPLYFLYSADSENWIFRAINRSELYELSGKGIEQGKLIINKGTKEGSGQVSSETLKENMGAFFKACQNLSFYAQDEKIDKLCAEFDPEEEGILLSMENGELQYKVVHGKERPELMCSRLFGGTVKGRPYMEDFMERSVRELMSVEEKTEAAENGDVDCMDELFILYSKGDEEQEIQMNPEKAVYWARKMAEAGNSNGMFNLGLHYAKGHGIERDFERAAYWMERAAEEGDQDAVAVAEQYRKMEEGIKKAEAGDAQAQADLADGFMRLGGSLDEAGPGKDYEESVYWAKKAAAQGNADAFWPLALAYHHGRGVEKNVDTAISYYMRGAELGNLGCMHNLGCEYIKGENLWRNEKKAFELFKKAAEQGYGLAMRDLGRCYQFGNGCTGNMKKAIEWYEKALEVINDPELEQKVTVFKMLGNSEAGYGDDYCGQEDPYENVKLEGTQYAGRADRCEKLCKGTKLTYKIIQGKYGDDTMEFFYLGGSVGFMDEYRGKDLAAFLKKDRISLEVSVESCVPKSQRGPRARNAEVYLKLDIKDKLPELPEDRERRLAEETARKKAEEEKRRQEEEAKKKAEAEEKAKQQKLNSMKSEYMAALEKWKRECTINSSNQKAYVAQKLNEKVEQIKTSLNANHAQEQERLKKALTDAETQKSEAEQKLNSLGFFKFGEKKETKALIERLSQTISTLRDEISSENTQYERNIQNAVNTVNSEKSIFESEANRIYPMLQEPEKPAELVREEQEAERKRIEAAEKEAREKQEQEQKAKRDREELKDHIIYTMMPGMEYTIQELMDMNPEIGKHLSQVVSSAMRQLLLAGEVKREERFRKIYYSLNL